MSAPRWMGPALLAMLVGLLTAPAAHAQGQRVIHLPLLGPPAEGWPSIAPSPRPSATATDLPTSPPTHTPTAASTPPAAASATPTSLPLPSPGAPSRREDLRWVGELAGGGRAVVVKGLVAYLGRGHRVVAVDLADPGRLRRAGEAGPFPGYVLDLALADGRLYVAAGEGGLRVVDLSDPLAPRELGALDTPGEARAVAVKGRMAYLADGPAGLRIVDISDPAAPRPAGHLETGHEANDVALDGGRAYLAVHAERSAGMLVMDVSDPARPRDLGAAATPGKALAVAVARGYAYLADDEEGLHVFDIAVPARPSLVTSIAGEYRGVFVSGNQAFLTSPRVPDSFGVHLLDLSDPRSPIFLDAFDASGAVFGLALQGGRLYAATDRAGLESIQITPQEPLKAIAVLDHPGLRAYEVAVSGDRAYVADGKTVRVIDVSEPASPREIGRSPALAGAADELPIWGEMAAVGDLAYFASPMIGGLKVLDATVPTAPRWIDTPAITDPLGPIDIQGRRGAVVDVLTGDLLALDVTVPTSPELLGRVPIPCQARALRVRGAITWVACGEGGLLAMDLADPAKARVVGSISGLGQVVDMSIQGRFAYVTDFGKQLHVLDLADPERPRRVGRLPLVATGGRLAVSGAVALLGNGKGFSLAMVDISDPAAPRALGDVPHRDQVYDVTAAGQHLYVCELAGGLQIFQVAP